MLFDTEEKQLKSLLECKGTDINLIEYIEDLKLLKKSIEENHKFSEFLKINKALSDKNRFLMFELLLEKDEMCICEFSIALGLTQPTISHHLKILEFSGLIEGLKSGNFMHYKIKNNKLLNYIEFLKRHIK
ncbi:MAG: ArsR/SmtB family transcription factor [Candidatus Helarchaeota archaeon]